MKRKWYKWRQAGERKSWDKPGLSCFWCLVCLFQLLTSLSQGMSTKCLTLLPFIFPICCHYFPFFPSFPLHFLSLSFPLYLFFASFYSMLFYSIIFSVYFSMFVSHDLSVTFLYDCLPLFFCLCPFAFLVLLVSFITLKHRNSKKNNVCAFFAKNIFINVSNIWKPPKHQMIIEFAKIAETTIKIG